LNLQVRSLLKDTQQKTFYVKAEEDNPTIYIASLPAFAEQFKEQGKGIVFIGQNYVFGLFGDPSLVDMKKLEEWVNVGR
jgi:hypothetical protein